MPIDLLIGVPIVGAVVAAFSGRLARVVALVTTLFTLVVALYQVGGSAFAGEGIHSSVTFAGLLPTWSLTLNGLSAPLVGLTVVLSVVAVLASWSVEEHPAAHHALLLGLEAAVLGVFLAEDVLLFYIFWEAVLIPMFFLIGVWGHENRKHAAAKFFIYTFAGSVLMLIGILMAIFAAGSTSISEIVSSGSVATTPVVFWLLLAGMLVKIPVVPLHTWLPDAHVEAPTAGSIMLAGVLLKMGGFGLLRLAVPMVPGEFHRAQGLLAILGIVGIVYGAAMALAQADLKRLVAYSSVAHMGFVVLAISTGTAAGFQAAMLGMVSHGVVAALLFLLVGQLYGRAHTRELAAFGGLGAVLPGWATAFTFAALASLGLPGLSGFPGEFVAVVEGFKVWGWWVVPATLGVVLAGAYNLRAVRSVNHGPVVEQWTHVRDLNTLEWIPVVILALAIVALGLWPRTVVDVTNDVFRMLALTLGGGA